MDRAGVAARSGITGSTIGEGGGIGRCSTGGRGDTGAIWGSMGDKMGEGGADSHIEGRGEDASSSTFAHVHPGATHRQTMVKPEDIPVSRLRLLVVEVVLSQL